MFFFWPTKKYVNGCGLKTKKFGDINNYNLFYTARGSSDAGPSIALKSSSSFRETTNDDSDGDSARPTVAERVAMFKRSTSNTAGIDPGTIQVGDLY